MASAIAAALWQVGAAWATEAAIFVATNAAYINAAIAITASSAYGAQQQRKAQAQARAAYNASLKDRELMIRSAVAPRRIIYGRDRVSGPIVYAQSTGAQGEYLHIVVALATHECDAIETVYFNDVALPDPDGSGFITSGDFAKTTVSTQATSLLTANGSGNVSLPEAASRVVAVGLESPDGAQLVSFTHTPGSSTVGALTPGTTVTVSYETTASAPLVRIKKHLGQSGQVADADLVAESGGAWTSAHVGTGVCYLYVRLKFDPDVFGATGLPNISAVVRGRKIRDPRDSITRWTENAALINASWLQDTQYGLRADAAHLPDAEVSAEANICDETVTLNLAGTDTQARYTFSGSFTTDQTPTEVLGDMLGGMAGTCVWTQGRWLLRAGAYRSPTVTIGPDDLAGRGLVVVPKASRSELFNAVRATYRDPSQAWAEVQAPLVTNSTYEAEDGAVRIVRSIQLPGVMDAWRAQRLAKIELERARQAVTAQCQTNLRPYDLAATDTATLQFDRYGWGAGKVFELRERTLNMDGTISHSLRETAASVWAWNYGEATAVDPAPDTDLPSPYAAPGPVAGLAVASGTAHSLQQADGTIVPRAYVSWSAVQQAFVTSGGKIDMQWRLTSTAPWEPLPPAQGTDTSAYIAPLPDNSVILVRARTVNAVGRASVWTTAAAVVRGSDTPAEDVAGLAATVANGIISWTWAAPAGANYGQTQVRTDGTGWADATPLWVGSASTYLQRVASAGTYTLRVRHRTRSGVLSTNTTSASAVVASGDLRDAGIDAALLAAAAAQATADGKIDTFYQTSAPGSASEGDLWFDTDDGNRQYRYTSGSWVAAADTRIGQAITDAAGAQATADGKVTTFYAASSPTAEGVGDLWIDTANSNQIKRWSGSSWVAVRDTGIDAALLAAAAAQATADGKIDTFYQTTAPGAAGEGDLWFDTDDGNRQYRYTSGSWVAAADARIGQAITDAAGAQATADGKVTTFVTSTTPTPEGVGDLWLDSANGNRLKRWDGSAWVLLPIGAGAIEVGAATDVVRDQGSVGYVGNLPGGGATSANIVIRTCSYTNSLSAAVEVEIEGGITASTLAWNSSYPSGATSLNLEWSSVSLSGSILLAARWPDSSLDQTTVSPSGSQIVDLPAGETLVASLRVVVTHTNEASIDWTSSRVRCIAIKR